jgi:hypothetical protein
MKYLVTVSAVVEGKEAADALVSALEETVAKANADLEDSGYEEED